MCWHCDNPDKTAEDYYDEVVLPIIRRCGWMVQFVGGTRAHAPFAYTAGLTDAGLPELVVTGLAHLRSAELLNAVAGHYLHADPVPVHGDRIRLNDGPCLEVVSLPHPDAHLLVARNLYGGALRAQQLVWCDDRGRWPWERGHRASQGGQPVLGPRDAGMPASMQAWPR